MSGERSVTDPVLPERLPLFPLPEHVLLPQIPTLYRVFEPRYRALVADLQELAEDERWLAVPRLAPGWRDTCLQAPEFSPIAAAALLRRVIALPNGEYHVVVEGLRRCELTEIATTKPYRLARAVPCDDIAEPGLDSQCILNGLLGKVQELGDRLRLPDGMSAPDFSGLDAVRILDRLAGVLLSDPDERQSWLECRALSKRAPMLVRAIERLRDQTPTARTRRWKPSDN